MPATTAKGYPYPLTSDPFLPASVDFPALAAACEAKSAREVAAVLSAATVGDVGVLGQVRAGRSLVVADFTTLLGLLTPILLAPLSTLTTNLGSGGALTNKGSVVGGKGITGTASEAAVFAGSTGQALYIADTGGADPFRILFGSWGCWFRTAKRDTTQFLVAKESSGNGGYDLSVSSTNVLFTNVCNAPTSVVQVVGTTDVADDRWHFAVVTFDGSLIRLYVDGALESSGQMVGRINGTSGPFNIGAAYADGSTSALSPFFGRIDEAFVTGDVLSADQIRVLMAAKVAHGYAVTPTRAHLALRRKRRGGVFATSDFSVTPLHLYNRVYDGDLGSLNSTQTVNGGLLEGSGPDGLVVDEGTRFDGSTNYVSLTDTGLPSGTSARTLGVWVKTLNTADQAIMGYGGETIYLDSTGKIGSVSVPPGGPAFNDGLWHFVVGVFDNAASSGVKTKFYVDGKIVHEATSIASLVLTGAAGFQIGRRHDTAALYFKGEMARAFVTGYAMAADEVAKLYAKGSAAIGPAPISEADHVLGFDATNVYVLHDDLESQHAVDLRVAA